jgi:hypothetical protein
MSEVPEGLHPMQYGLAILEQELGWPAKGNCELMADCLTAIQKSKRLSETQAYKYMVRAIKLAKEQGVTVDRMFFMNGVYTHMRPPAKLIEKKYCGNCEAGWVIKQVTNKYGKSERRATPCSCRLH